MNGSGPKSDEARRIAELQRVNEELAAELRSLTLGRTGFPRRDPLPASREIAKLNRQRDTVVAELEETRAQLADTKAQLSDTSAQLANIKLHREGLELQNQELAQEVARLSAGFPGILRRLRGRFAG